jgi:deoxyribodipyrimidine photolyase
MNQRKILVPIGAFATNLKSVYYAVALADRLRALIYIVQQVDTDQAENHQMTWFRETLRDLINNTRQTGIGVSHYMVRTNFKEEIVNLIRAEHIDLLVFSKDEETTERLVHQIRSLIPGQIIQVREKHEIQHMKEDEKRYGTRNDLKPV